MSKSSKGKSCGGKGGGKRSSKKPAFPAVLMESAAPKKKAALKRFEE